jgi:hypothetical protein
VYEHGKTKIRWHSIGNVYPVFGTVVGAIQSPMILQKKAFGPIGMHRDFVYALAELGILVGHQHGADAAILRGPGTAAIAGTVNAAGGNCHVHALAVRGVEHDGVQSQTSIARHPAGTMGMIE